MRLGRDGAEAHRARAEALDNLLLTFHLGEGKGRFRPFDAQEGAQIRRCALGVERGGVLLEQGVIACAGRLLQKRDCQRIITVRLLAAALAVDTRAFQREIDIEAERVKRLAVQCVDLLL